MWESFFSGLCFVYLYVEVHQMDYNNIHIIFLGKTACGKLSFTILSNLLPIISVFSVSYWLNYRCIKIIKTVIKNIYT